MSDRSSIFVIAIVALVAVVGLVTLFVQDGQSHDVLLFGEEGGEVVGQAYQFSPKYLPKYLPKPAHCPQLDSRPVVDARGRDCTTEIVITDPSDGSVCKELEVFRNDAGDLYDVGGPRPVRVHHREAMNEYTYTVSAGAN